MNYKSSGTILFFDSGIGGVPYLSHLRDKLPNEKFVYVADSKNFPYGEKDHQQIIEILTNIIKPLIDTFKPKVIVIACNTASVTALKDLREITDVPIVGVVPAIKTAAESKSTDNIGILATKRTVNGDYLQNLIEKYSFGKNIIKLGASGIVKYVEYEFFNQSAEHRKKFIKESVSHLITNDVDTVVLGCTHFIHVEDEIRDAFCNQVNIVDSREGVSRQIIRVLNKNINDEGRGYSHFYQTENVKSTQNYKKLCSNVGFEYKGELVI